MTSVFFPQIVDEDVIKYLMKNGYVTKWEERPTYQELYYLTKDTVCQTDNDTAYQTETDKDIYFSAFQYRDFLVKFTGERYMHRQNEKIDIPVVIFQSEIMFLWKETFLVNSVEKRINHMLNFHPQLGRYMDLSLVLFKPIDSNADLKQTYDILKLIIKYQPKKFESPLKFAWLNHNTWGMINKKMDSRHYSEDDKKLFRKLFPYHIASYIFRDKKDQKYRKLLDDIKYLTPEPVQTPYSKLDRNDQIMIQKLKLKRGDAMRVTTRV